VIKLWGIWNKVLRMRNEYFPKGKTCKTYLKMTVFWDVAPCSLEVSEVLAATNLGARLMGAANTSEK
jgi:hypothetical protein